MGSDGGIDMTKLIAVYRNLAKAPLEISVLKTHLNKETSVLGCEGVFDEVVSAFSMDRGVFIFRVEQLQLCYFLIPCSEDEDIMIVRNVEICWWKYTTSYKKKLGTSVMSLWESHIAHTWIRCKPSYLPTSLCDVDAFSYDMGHLVSCSLLFSWTFKSIYLFIYLFIHSFIHSFILYSILRQVHSFMPASASSVNFQHPLFSLSSLFMSSSLSYSQFYRLLHLFFKWHVSIGSS